MPILKNLAYTCLIVALLAILHPATIFAAETKPVKTAVFDFELMDTSLEGAMRGIDPAETKRLRLVSDLLRDMLGKSSKYEIVDLAPVAAKIEDAGYIHGCNGCDAELAKLVGAQHSITGQIHKISTLILNIRIFERDAETGEYVQVAVADIRGNTDESWTHGVRWLVRNRLLAQ